MPAGTQFKEPAPPALPLMDEAVALIRRAPFSTLALYYIGALPFVAGLITFWALMSQSAYAYRELPAAALGLACLYLWMKTWQARFTSHMLALVRDDSAQAWGVRGFCGTLCRQAAIQVLAIAAMPVAVLLLAPLGWFHAACQNATVLDAPGISAGALASASLREARRWPRQNHMIIWLLSPLLVSVNAVLIFALMPVIGNLQSEFTMFVASTYVVLFGILSVMLCPGGAVTALGIFSSIFAAVELAHLFLGIETPLSRAPGALLNSTFIALVCGLTYLVLDPVLKTAYVLRCFRAQSLTDGADLRIQLRHARAAKALTLLICCCAGFTNGAWAQNTDPAPAPPLAAPAQLDAAIDAEFEGARYAWRMPRVNVPNEDENFVVRGVKGVMEKLKEWIERIQNKLEEWRDRFRRGGGSSAERSGMSITTLGWLLKGALALLIAGLAIMLVVLLVRLQRQRRATALVSAPAAAEAPDIRDEGVQADALPENEWLRMAREHAAAGDYRTGARALFLAILAHLADAELIYLAKHKSNRDYHKELLRRDPVTQGQRERFAQSIFLYESVWYGVHPADRELFSRLWSNMEALRFHQPGTRPRAAQERLAHA